MVNPKSFYLFLLIFIVSCSKKLPVNLHLAPDISLPTSPDILKLAGDPILYLDSKDEMEHAIIITDRQKSLRAYSLRGEELAKLEFEKISMIDIRQNYAFELRSTVLIGGANTENNSLEFFEWDTESLALKNLSGMEFFSLVDKIISFCLYQDPQTKKMYAFVGGINGEIEQWELNNGTAGIIGKLVRSFDVGKSCSALIADDAQQLLYVADPSKGIWQYSADPNAKDNRKRVLSARSNPYVQQPISDISIITGTDNTSFLVATSEGNRSLAVFKCGNRFSYSGSFKLSEREGKPNESLAIYAISTKLNDQFPNGAVIVSGDKQLGLNILDWDKIMTELTKPTKEP